MKTFLLECGFEYLWGVGVGFGKGGGGGLELGGVRDIIQHVMIEVMPQLWHDIVTNSDQ